MKIIETSDLQGDLLPDTISRSRLALVFLAFWHTLRRDLTVTAREFVPFILQVLMLPVSLLFVFGRVLPGGGTTNAMYPALFLPGVIASTIFLASLQGITIALMMDLDYNREIDDRLLAPMPISLIAVEKVVFATIRSMVAGILTFPLAYAILGSGYQVRTDMILPLLGIMLLYTLSSTALGLVIGAALPANQLYLIFSVIFNFTLYLGCVYYTWSNIASLKVLQIMTLFNPLTYASEGMRYTMVPPQNGQPIATLAPGWVLLGLSVSFVIFLIIGIRIFRGRVIS